MIHEQDCRDYPKKKAHSRLLDLNSKAYRAFLKMEGAAYSEGSLSKKIKELIAVGISVVINCESCMEWRIKEMARNCATREEVLEAVEVGIEMEGGPAKAYAWFALEVMDAAFANW